MVLYIGNNILHILLTNINKYLHSIYIPFPYTRSSLSRMQGAGFPRETQLHSKELDMKVCEECAVSGSVASPLPVLIENLWVLITLPAEATSS